jgi:signal transduction histidine kinase/ActR/RegA family two-component response regulator
MMKHEEQRILILAPTGRDATITHQILRGAGLECRVCAAMQETCSLMAEGAGAIVLADEALSRSSLMCLTEVLDGQQSWSDIPLIVFPANGENTAILLDRLGARANVMILERPVRIEILVNAVKAALRARRRQYQTRDLLFKLAAADREKDLFLATLSHELRTPLTAILGWSRLLQAGELPKEKAELALEVINRNATAQVQLIADILSVSQIVAGSLQVEMEPVELEPVIEAAIESARPTAQARNNKNATILEADVTVLGDAGRLQQIVTNLLTNAIKFTAPKGRIEVELASAGGHCQIVVRDTGKGISPEFLPHVFDRFRQADSSATRTEGGLGLGLAIVQHLVTLHKGTVAAKSDGLNTGAALTVTLPSTQRSMERTMASAAPTEAALDGLYILVVDDDPESLCVLETTLRQYGAAVTAVNSAHAALETLKTRRPDVLVSDIAMPELSGYDLLREVAAVVPDGSSIPAIALTGYASHDDRQRTLAAGFRLHMPKPFEPLELVRSIDQLRPRAQTINNLGRG